MSRYAFRMQLKQGMEAEYKAAHDAIWPELAKLLHDSGVRDYAIFHDGETGALFATLTIEGEDKRAQLPANPIMQRWWAAMAPLMETHDDNRPMEWPLTQMFHLA